MFRHEFDHRLLVTPERPGVYLMKNAKGAVIYVGKAAVLRNRLRSYFGSPAGLDRKTRRMVSELSDFEYIVTDTEAEALILENTLIKRHRPYFNVRLKDDKTYPYLKVDLAEEFPRVYITRGVHADGARYFGPFASAGSVRQSMDLVKKLFPYRSCTKRITGTDPRPCLEYYIHRCVGPCAGLATREEYDEVIKQVILFLEGNTETVTGQIRDKMEQAAESLEFERAAVLRDQMGAIQKFEEERTVKVDSGRDMDLDAIAVAVADPDSRIREAWVEAFFIRRGKLIGRDHFFMEGPEDDEPGAVIAQFVQQFYATALEIPPTILIQHDPPAGRRPTVTGLPPQPARRRGSPVPPPARRQSQAGAGGGGKRRGGFGPASGQVAQPLRRSAGRAHRVGGRTQPAGRARAHGVLRHLPHPGQQPGGQHGRL